MPELENKKHERFAQEYILDYNATAAALRTGYKESNARKQGSALLTNQDILARVRELQQEQAKRLAITADMVLIEALKTYQKCLSPTPVLQRNEKTGKYEEVGIYTFDSKGALKALDMLGKATGLYERPAMPATANNLLEVLTAATAQQVGTDDIPEIL